MKSRMFRSGCVAAVVLVSVCVSLPAQGTKADYERAGQLRRLVQHKVFKDKVQPHWLAGGTRFWYRNDLAGDQREFIVVDAVQGTRRPAFDHAKVAFALAKATGKEVAATGLPIDEIEFSEGEPAVVVLRGPRGAWRCDLRTYELRQEKGPAATPASLPATGTPRPSRRDEGPETYITFVNRTAGKVEILWIDPEGQRRHYETLEPGGRHEQQTFAGHVWLATDAHGAVLGVFEATAQPATAVIDGTVQADRPGPPRPRPGRSGQPRSGGPRSNGPRSGDGKWLAVFKDHNLFLRNLGDDKEFPLTTDGSEQDEYGGGVFWSPDSAKLVVLRTRQGDDRQVYYVESSPRDQLQPKLHNYGYLKPGDRIPLSRPHLFDVPARRHVPIGDELFGNPWSVGEVRWAGDSSRFTFLYNQRGHQVMRVIAVDAATGKAQAIIDEQSPTFIDYAGKHFSRYLDATGEIIWMSERDGWNHLYLYDARTGRVKNQITRGAWVVRGVDKVDAQKRQIWFRAGGIIPGQDPYLIHYARVNFDGTGLVVLTAADGTHSVEFSPDGRFFLDTYSRVDLPPATELRRSDDGKLVCELERADWSALLKTGWKVPEPFVAKGRDGTTDIYGVIFRPTNLDPGKKYPVIEEIYAGPQDSFVPKSFRSLHSPQVLAELGFIVVKIDGMGTSNRSKKFHDVCWKNLSDAGLPDRVLWIKAAAAKYPCIDSGRVGICGTSAGGQSALRALIDHGDFYQAAVADCGCHDNRMDKIWWNELWMGWPVGPQYAQNSNVTQAHKLRGKLLLMVGEDDQNVDPASTLQVVNALIKADKDFDLLVMPGQGHGVTGTAYGKRRLEDFFVRNLLGVEPRRP